MPGTTVPGTQSMSVTDDDTHRILGEHASPSSDLIALAICAALLVIAAAALVGPVTYDDGYITYRYADNWARGDGMTFNPGERVLGTTAAGWAIVLGILTKIGKPLGIEVAHWGMVVSLLAYAAIALALARAARALTGRIPTAVWLFMLLLFSSRWNLEMVGAENVPIVALFSLAFMYAIEGRSEVVAGLLAGSGAALRFDAGLGVVALGLALWIDRRRLPWRFGLAAATPVAACVAWLVATFGTFLPNTLGGKRSEIHLVSTSYSRSEYEWLVRAYSPVAAPVLVILALAGLAFAFRWSGRARVFAVAFGSWVVAHEFFYRFVGVPFAPWYHVLGVNVLLALAALGAVTVARSVGSRIPTQPRGRRAAASVMILAMITPAAVASALFIRDHLSVPPDPRLRVYRSAAAHLARVSRPDDSVAAVEIGALAYYSDRHVLDLVGLVTPGMLQARSENSVTSFFYERPPEYVIDNPLFHPTFLAPVVEGGRLETRYREIAAFTAPEYPIRVRLMKRRDLEANRQDE